MTYYNEEDIEMCYAVVDLITTSAGLLTVTDQAIHLAPDLLEIADKLRTYADHIDTDVEKVKLEDIDDE